MSMMFMTQFLKNETSHLCCMNFPIVRFYPGGDNSNKVWPCSRKFTSASQTCDCPPYDPLTANLRSDPRLLYFRAKGKINIDFVFFYASKNGFSSIWHTFHFPTLTQKHINKKKIVCFFIIHHSKSWKKVYI